MVMGWLFPAKTLDILRQAAAVSYESSSRMNYSVAKDVDLFVYFDKQTKPMLAPASAAMSIDPVAALPLLDTIAQMRKVFESFAAVDHVMRWLDNNATPGAIRYYWPTMLSLVPDCAAVNIETPTRFIEPKGLAPLLPLLRETATTVASALLLPANDEQGTTKGLSLQFSQQTFMMHGIEIVAEPKTYNL